MGKDRLVQAEQPGNGWPERVDPDLVSIERTQRSVIGYYRTVQDEPRPQDRPEFRREPGADFRIIS
jgi:hypothetical protein